MKKAFIVITTLCAMALGFMACSGPELKNVHTMVDDVIIENDTLTAYTVSIAGEKQTVSLRDARFQGSLPLKGDSIILDYIDGKDNTLRALVVTMLPKSIQTSEPNDTLITKESKDSIK